MNSVFEKHGLTPVSIVVFWLLLLTQIVTQKKKTHVYL